MSYADDMAARAEDFGDLFDAIEKQRAALPCCPKHANSKLEPASEAFPNGFCWACYREAHPEKKKRRNRRRTR